MSGTDRASFVSGVFCVRSALSDLTDGLKRAGWAARFIFCFSLCSLRVRFYFSVLLLDIDCSSSALDRGCFSNSTV